MMEVRLEKSQVRLLQDRITEMLGKPFTFKGTRISEHDRESSFDVVGTMKRHDTTVNVKVHIHVSANHEFTPSYWSITDETISLLNRYIGKMRLSKNVVVSDPSYDRDVWCMTELSNVKPGIWTVHAAIDTIDSWGERCYVIELCHETVDRDEELAWTDHFELGVDSGTMSVIDSAYYQKDPGPSPGILPETTAKDRFLNKCFNLTDNRAGILKNGNKCVGAVCSSGIGDGGYPLYVVEEDGEIVAMKISFM